MFTTASGCWSILDKQTNEETGESHIISGAARAEKNLTQELCNMHTAAFGLEQQTQEAVHPLKLHIFTPAGTIFRWYSSGGMQ
jgi:hypothetical protein